MNRIIAYVGVIGSGKDHSAKELMTYGDIAGEVWTKCDFADSLRTFASKILDLDFNRIDYEAFKEESMFRYLTYMTGRGFLQNLGKTMREFDIDFWIKAWRNSLPDTNIVVSDCRYPNEFQAVLDMGGEVMFTNYVSDRYDADNKHESEQMAQWFVKNGYKHKQELTRDDLDKYMEDIK